MNSVRGLAFVCRKICIGKIQAFTLEEYICMYEMSMFWHELREIVKITKLKYSPIYLFIFIVSPLEYEM